MSENIDEERASAVNNEYSINYIGRQLGVSYIGRQVYGDIIYLSDKNLARDI